MSPLHPRAAAGSLIAALCPVRTLDEHQIGPQASAPGRPTAGRREETDAHHEAFDFLPKDDGQLVQVASQ